MNYSAKILALIAAFFIIVEFHQLTLPAFHEEEAQDVPMGLYELNFDKIANFESFISHFPTTLCFYHGAFQSYLMFPFCVLLGISAFSMRLYAIFTGLLILAAVYFVAKEFIDKKVASLAVILLTLNYVFLEHIKFGIAYGSIMQFIMLLTLLLLLRWYRRKNYLYFYAAFFLMGIGLSVRLYFLWFIIGVFSGSFLFFEKLKQEFFSKKKCYLCFVIAATCFGLGSSLLILGNISTGFRPIKLIISHSLISACGVNNLNYFQNLFSRISQFISILAGELEFGFIYFGHKNNYLYPVLFFLCLIWLISLLMSRRLKKLDSFGVKRISFFVVLFLAMFACSPFTLSSFRPSHMMMFYPFLAILMATAIISFLNYFKNNAVRTLCITFCLSAITMDFCLFSNMVGNLNKTGGRELYSDSIYSLADFLKTRDSVGLFCFNPRLSPILYVLGARNIEIRKTPGIVSDPEVNKNLPLPDITTADLTKRNNLFIFHATIDNQFIQNFYSFAETNNKTVVMVKQFYDRCGLPTFILYSAFPKDISIK